MKKLLILLSVLFSLVFSPPSYSEWKEVSKSLSGTTFYVDYERIKKRGDYTFYWQLADYVKPSPNGSVSSKVYSKVDCNLFRYKFLSDWYYKKQMGQGEAHSSSTTPDEDWNYPHPDSSLEYILESVCSW